MGVETKEIWLALAATFFEDTFLRCKRFSLSNNRGLLIVLSFASFCEDPGFFALLFKATKSAVETFTVSNLNDWHNEFTSFQTY